MEVLLSQLGSARGRDGANSSQQLNFPLLPYTDGGKEEEEEMCWTSSGCTLNRVIKLYRGIDFWCLEAPLAGEVWDVNFSVGSGFAARRGGSVGLLPWALLQPCSHICGVMLCPGQFVTGWEGESPTT